MEEIINLVGQIEDTNNKIIEAHIQHANLKYMKQILESKLSDAYKKYKEFDTEG